MMSKHKTVIGSFRDHAAAQLFFDTLTSRGFAPSDINLMMSDATRTREYAWDARDEKDRFTGSTAGNKAAEGAGIGSAIGSAVGGTIAAIAAAGTSLVVPGLNLVVAGPIVAALAGAGAGAMTGGFVGGLVGLGIPEQDAKAYNEALKRGGVVMSVATQDDAEAREIKDLMTHHGGEQVLCV
jgi:hypothetical protein